MQLDGYIVGLIKQGVNALMGNLPELDALFKYLSRNYNIQILGEQVGESGNNSYLCKIDGVEYELLIEQGNVWLVDAQGKAEYLGQMVSEPEKRAAARSRNSDKTKAVVVEVATEGVSSSEVAVSVAVVSSDAYGICDESTQSCPETSDSTALANSARPFSLSAPICRTPEDEKNLQPEEVVEQRREAIKAASKTGNAVKSADTEKPVAAPVAELEAVSEEVKAIAQKNKVESGPTVSNEVPVDSDAPALSGFVSGALTFNSGSVSISGSITNTSPALSSGFVPSETGVSSRAMVSAMAVFDAADLKREERRTTKQGEIFSGIVRNDATDCDTVNHLSNVETVAGISSAAPESTHAAARGSGDLKVASVAIGAGEIKDAEEGQVSPVRSGHRFSFGEELFGAGEQSFIFGEDPIEIARACAMSGLWPACLMVAFASQSRPAAPISETVRKGTGTQVASANARRGHGDERQGHGSGDGRRHKETYNQFSEEA